jgi:hypothetical protein
MPVKSAPFLHFGRSIRGLLAAPPPSLPASQAIRDFFSCGSAPGALLEDSYRIRADQYDSSVVMDEGEELVDPDYIQRAQVAFSGWETTHFQVRAADRCRAVGATGFRCSPEDSGPGWGPG